MPAASRRGERPRFFVHLTFATRIPLKTFARQSAAKVLTYAPSARGRVGMWRGRSRPGMSVAAPHMGVISRLRAECLELVSRLIKQEPE